MRKITVTAVLMLLSLFAAPAFAAPFKVFVAKINSTGVKNSDEMQTTIQTLLASRLSSEKIQVVEKASDADAVIHGTYISIGKIFSLDAIAKTAEGEVIARTFVQGKNEDELIPAVGSLAEKLTAELLNLSVSMTTALTSKKENKEETPKTDLIINNEIKKAAVGEFIKPEIPVATANIGWLSQRLDGASNLMASGRKFSDGSREMFLADAHRLTCYKLEQGKDLKLVNSTILENTEKIISLDTMERDGGVDIYLTVIRSGELASQVWFLKDDKLTQSARGLGYYFRTNRINGGEKKLYIQAMGRTEDFYGEVAEAARNGADIIPGKKIRMPRHGNIYSFSQFKDLSGNVFTVVINPDGYLVVYDQNLSEIWRSNDKFGGSELYFKKDDDANMRITGETSRWIFMNQRIQITAKGELLVGKNDGFWVLGNSRSYKSGAVYCLVWNGSSLEEKWHTRATQNYMPDYYLDESENELFLLQTVQRPGIKTEGASSLSIKKVE
ncbi:MAG: VCBS repeat-containing protein [Desulfuromonadaceae bacterium]|nr:VCBS repeat-containing protein [Desulfuromonadaceae bacterium]MDD2853955.1 VCBS repeat-containing protein [Desulfuromonadaceae bacterium]